MFVLWFFKYKMTPFNKDRNLTLFDLFPEILTLNDSLIKTFVSKVDLTTSGDFINLTSSTF